MRGVIDDEPENSTLDRNKEPQEAVNSEERTRNNDVQKEDAQRHSPAEIAVTDRLLRSRQRRNHCEEKGNTEVLCFGKKRDLVIGAPMKKDAHTRKHPRSQHTADPALELYIIRDSGKKAYSIQPVWQVLPKWQNLVSLSTVVSARENYSVNDVVYILMQGEQDDAIAQIREIRDLGDGRKVICVSWYYSRYEMRANCANMSLWPEDCSYMLSTQLQVLMWDTMNGKVEQKELEAVVAGKVVDVSAKPYRIIDQNNPSVEWLFKSPR
jgi:hypothetical protein